jgi:hypothetical protein
MVACAGDNLAKPLELPGFALWRDPKNRREFYGRTIHLHCDEPVQGGKG